MSRYNKPVATTWHNLLLQAAVVVAAIVVIVLSLPRDEQSRLDIDVGKPWPYSQFIAPFDFAIFKSDEQLQHEHDSLSRLYQPYFELQTTVVAEQIAHFRADFAAPPAENLSPTYRTYIEQHLRDIYQRGIVSTKDFQLLTSDSCIHVRVFHGTEASLRATNKILSQKAAYEALLSGADSAHISRQELQRLNLNRYVQPNLRLDEEKTLEQRKEVDRSVSPSFGMVMAGQSIIDRGEIVSEHTHRILKSYERALAARNQVGKENRLAIIGQATYVAIVIICLLLYFNLFRRDYLGSPRTVTLLITAVLIPPLITATLVRHTFFSVYIIPYAMLPIFIRVFMDSRTAFITHACAIFLSAISLRYPFEFITTECIAGLVAIYTLRELSERSQLFRTALFVTGASILCYLSLDLLHGHQISNGETFIDIDWLVYQHIIASGFLLLFAYPLMFALEKLFGFTSNVTLVELSNTNHPLLRRLSEQAPGTFQHSIQVSNLAAEVARKIGAKSQLVRTGALYHDIGKMQNPAFFTENQMGNVNPHDKLDFAESARIIINHVRDGELMADKARLPKVIRQFISTHHGHGLVKYFYISCQNQNPGRTIDPEPFTYPCPNPFTTEQAILLMADAVEASARSLKDYDEQSISQLVDQIIDTQVKEGRFAECPITFLDIRTAKEVFKDKLKTIYHTRISYPTPVSEAQPAKKE